MSLYRTQGEGSFAVEDRVSIVFALLPTAVQSRIKPLRHIRRSISLGSIKTRGVLNDEIACGRTRSEGSNTPSESIDVAGEDMQMTSGGNIAVDGARRAGIRHKFAQQGTRLIGISLAGEDVPSGAMVGDFERDAYIDGLSYLLRGLPENLTSRERERLRLSMPAELEMAIPTSMQTTSQTEPRSSSVYRLTNAAVVNTVIVLSLLVPYLVLLLQWLASLERRYKVSESVGQLFMSITSTVAHKATRVVDASRSGNGRVGDQVLGNVLWTVEEVTRGLYDGVDRGISDVRAQRMLYRPN